MTVAMLVLRALVVVIAMVLLTLATAKTMEIVIRFLVLCTGGQQKGRDCQYPWAWLSSICIKPKRRNQDAHPAAILH